MKKAIIALALALFSASCGTNHFLTDLQPTLRYHNSVLRSVFNTIYFTLSNPTPNKLAKKVLCQDMYDTNNYTYALVTVEPYSDRYIAVPFMNSGNYSCKIVDR